MARSSSATDCLTARATILALALLLVHAIGQAGDLPVYATDAGAGYRDMLHHAGERHVYLIGDATHGTREFYLFRQQVTRELVVEHGLRRLVLEIGPDEAEPIDQWLQAASSEPGDTAGILCASVNRWPHWVWANHEVAGFLGWLRAFNRDRPASDRVRLHGMDLQQLGTPESEIYADLVSTDPYASWNYRANHMADQVIAVLSSRDPVVVWAHNNHVGDKRADDVRGTGLISLGQLLRERLGDTSTFVLGSAGYEGRFVAAPRWGDAHQVVDLPPAVEGSVESLLSRTTWDNPLLYWEDASQRALWSFESLHRGVGVVYQDSGNGKHDLDTYVVTQPGLRYDALVFFRESRPLMVLDSRDCAPAEQARFHRSLP